ncbi:MAG: EAL domain-containing protein [Acidobacteria bacterium]|nr:EAL domain-containing protein [Acidobacteriota bacterium]
MIKERAIDEETPEALRRAIERLEREVSQLRARVAASGGAGREVAGRQLAQEWLRIIASALENAGEGIMIMAAAGRPFRLRTLYVNEGFSRITGIPAGEAEGNPLKLISVRPEDREVMLLARRRMGEGLRFAGEVTAIRPGGQEVALEMQFVPVRDETTGRLTHWVAILRDVSERRAQMEALRHQALHDALTGLPNWSLLEDRLRQTVLGSARRDEVAAIVMIDFDHFKDVNDTYGYAVGDAILREAGIRISGSVRATDTVARVGGDEFAVLLPAVGNRDVAERIARKVLTAFEQPVDVDGHKFDIAVSIGIALFPAHGSDGDALRRRADIAMYVAKEAQAGYAVYSETSDRHRSGYLAVAHELRRAIDGGELLLHYQPKAHLRSGLVTRVEALVRWHHPERGMVPPMQFIPLAERTGLVKPMTTKILDIAMAQCRAWQAEGTPISIAVNLSTRTLQESFLPELIESLLDRWKVEPQFLKLEITESSMMSEPDRVISMLEKVHAMGVHLSLDDFGTGFSSLAYLRRLPVDEIKIDKSFVKEMTRNASDAEIVRATIDLAHNLGRQVVAEGIEDADTWAMLRELGCDLGQGYFLSKPLPSAELSDWLRTTRMGLARNG